MGVRALFVVLSSGILGSICGIVFWSSVFSGKGGLATDSSD